MYLIRFVMFVPLGVAAKDGFSGGKWLFIIWGSFHWLCGLLIKDLR